MQVQRWRKAGAGTALALAALFAASWRAAHWPYVTPGSHQVFRMDSAPGALLEFFVLLTLVIVGVATLARVVRGGWVCAGIAASYVTSVMLVSLLTPRTIVSMGDSYCWDLWCVGIQNVKAAPQGQNAIYTAEVSLSVDSDSAELVLKNQADQAKRFFTVVDDQGRRFLILSAGGADVTVKPGAPVKSSLTFLAPANARTLYLAADISAPLWVRLYFGSDLNPFHRRTLLRVG